MIIVIGYIIGIALVLFGLYCIVRGVIDLIYDDHA